MVLARRAARSGLASPLTRCSFSSHGPHFRMGRPQPDPLGKRALFVLIARRADELRMTVGAALQP